MLKFFLKNKKKSDKKDAKKMAKKAPAKTAAKEKKTVAKKEKKPKKEAPKTVAKKIEPKKAAPKKVEPKVAAKKEKDTPKKEPEMPQVKARATSLPPKPSKKDAKPTLSLKPGSPVLKIVLCGPHSVYWIPDDTVIPDDIFDEGLHPKELDMSKELKAPTRKREFLRARWLCRRVIKVKDPLLKAKTGEPLWPTGVIGSISHKDGHVLFCKSTSELHYCLGMDIEKISKVTDNIESKICTPEESTIIDRVSALARYKRQEALALIFSFKEAIFKTHFPTGKTMFNFHDVTITEIAYERREIMARMNINTSPHSAKGHITLGFYNWIEKNGEKFVVVVAEERKPMQVDQKLKEELLAEVEPEPVV